MGYDNEHADRPRLIFDIETAPLPDAEAFMDDLKAPANYRDPEKIAAYKAEQVARAGLDVDLCRIVAIGTLRGVESEPMTDVVRTPADERVQCLIDEVSLLKGFWSLAKGCHLVGFNVLFFDLPVLQRRSLYLGVPVPQLNIDKYRHAGITDLLSVLTYNGMLKARSLAFYAKRFGIPHDDPVTGADIAGLVERGEWAAVEAHCRADVLATAALADRLGVR